MELKVFRDVLPAAGADCTAKAELPLETELLISDYLPPVQRIVKCFAKPVVLQKQLAPGRLTLEGYLRCTVYYQGEEGAGLCQTEQKLPFTKALELPSFAATAWTACVEGQTEYLNCRAVNPRRIEVRGAYGLVVSVYAQLSTEVITALSEGGIEQKPVTLAGVRRAATLEKLVTIEGALTFPKPPAAILDITGTAEVRELKRMQGKAVAKGVLHVLCGWRAEGDAALRSQTADLPEDADAYPECGLSVQDLQCASAGGALDVALTVRAEGAVLARKTASLVGAVELGDPLAPADPEVSLRICYAQPGEELFAIARRYHVSPGQMLAANDLPDGTARLDEARRLLVPGV